MGVYRTDYLFYGVKIDPDKVDWDKHEDLICGAPDAAFDMVYDGMNGKYAVAGKIIAKSDGYDEFGFTEITPDLLPADPADLMAKITEQFGPQADAPKLFLFSHFA
jgi:hypothetical protein